MLVKYELADRIATLTMDDGKANVLSPQMLKELNAALDRAEADKALVILTSARAGLFSGGFDLAVLGSNPTNAMNLVNSGFQFAARLMTYPRPVIVACTGHAIAMGLFTLLSADYRLGAEGAFKFVANEVAIGMTLPRPALEICRNRLAPAQFQRAMLLSEVFSPADAVTAGILDRIVPAAELQNEARAVAKSFLKLVPAAHAGTKERLRGPVARAVLAAIDTDMAELKLAG
jgi:enoyl-CoA hydratase